METTTTEQKEMTITDENGTEHKVMAEVVTTDHGTTDEAGNPKISVNIKVPPVTVGVIPGKVE